MVYVMSDIHGCYNEYIAMLEKIKFNDNDTLYVIGDICERGEDTIKLLLHMMNHKNIIPIWGNHDITTFESLSIVCDYAKEVLEDHRYMVLHNMIDYFDYYQFIAWFKYEYKTFEDFANLSITKRHQILEYFRSFKKYVELELNNQKYILVHGGIPNTEKEINEFSLEDLVWERPDYNKKYYEDKIIISGHTPTIFINEDGSNKIYNKNNNIVIDSGCVFGYQLSCLCLDNMQEFYVKKV